MPKFFLFLYKFYFSFWNISLFPNIFFLILRSQKNNQAIFFVKWNLLIQICSVYILYTENKNKQDFVVLSHIFCSIKLIYMWKNATYSILYSYALLKIHKNQFIEIKLKFSQFQRQNILNTSNFKFRNEWASAHK